METPPLLVAARPPDWWERNWKWATVVIALVIGAFVGGFFLVGESLLKVSGAQREALARVEAATAFVELLGQPVEEGAFVTGTLALHDSTGETDLSFPISGPRGKAMVYAKAKKILGKWEFTQLIVETHDGRKKIDLMTTDAAKSLRP